MKALKLKLLLLSILICASSIKAQYYKPTRKNKALLISNAYSLDKIPVLTNSLEFGKMFIYNRLLVHGGLGFSNSILKNAPRDVEQTNYINKSIYNGLVGADINVFGFHILNLSHKTFCKYFDGNLFVGFDAFKNLQTSLANDYGYRAKACLAFSIVRSGSNKKDIGYRRFMQLGYCYTNNNNIKNNIPYHSIMLNVLIVKQRLIKFADWY
jgi:hypothetical protein